MPALYSNEALKAQAIASRTYALYQRDINNVNLTRIILLSIVTSST